MSSVLAERKIFSISSYCLWTSVLEVLNYLQGERDIIMMVIQKQFKSDHNWFPKCIFACLRSRGRVSYSSSLQNVECFSHFQIWKLLIFHFLSHEKGLFCLSKPKHCNILVKINSKRCSEFLYKMQFSTLQINHWVLIMGTVAAIAPK